MSGTTVHVERDESGATILRLRPMTAAAPVVVLNRELLSAIDRALDDLTSGDSPRGFVLASDSRVFVAGADLKEIMGLADADLHEYLRFGQQVCGRIARLRCTTVAAINGAALGGGLEIAMHCDRLIAVEPAPGTPDKPARPYPIGLPEASLCICPGWGGTNTLPARMDPARAIEMTAAGRPFSVIDAHEAGLVEELTPPADLIPRACALAGQPKPSPRLTPRCISDPQRRSVVGRALEMIRNNLPKSAAAEAVADCVQAGLDRGWQAALDAERENLVRLRNTPEARAAIEAFFARSRH